MSKEKQTIAQKIRAKKIKRPPAFLYSVLGGVWKAFVMPKYNVKITDKCEMAKVKEPHIMVSNHASRVDYVFMALALIKQRYNFVIGYNEYFRSHLNGVLSLMQVISKKNFTPDMYTIRSIKGVLKAGGNIAIFPEGMSSISGANQPVAVGTGNFIKHMGVPVYYSKIKGGYLTTPKYNLDERLGTVEVEYDKLFSLEDLKALTPSEIEDRMNEALYHDDYKWNKEKKYVFKHNGNIAGGLHDLLFRCPKCKKDFTMLGEGNQIKCTACGNGATLDDTYAMTPFDDDCVIFDTQTEWFNWEREQIKQEIKQEGFTLKEHVQLGVLPDYELLTDLKTSLIVGEGDLTLDKTGLRFDGVKNGEKFEFFIPITEVPTYGMCTDVSRFYTFYKGEFVEFYPQTHCVEKWFLATEELHRANGGVWQDFKFDK